MLVQDLPQEILLNVFGHTARHDLGQYFRVCKLWHVIALQEFYRVLLINSGNREKVRTMLRNGSFGGRYGVGPLIRILKMPALDRDNYLFGSLVSQLPKLNTITFPHPYAFHIYAQAMHNLAEITNYFDKIQQVSITGNSWMTPDQEAMHLYFTVCYKLRHSLRHIQLYYMQQGYNVGNRSGLYMNYLTEFTNLTHLAINNCRRENGDESLLMFTALNQCPNLIYYKFDSDYDTSDRIADSILQTMDSSANQVSTAITSRLFHQTDN